MFTTHFNMTGDLNNEDLNEVLAKNPEANRRLYNKLKEINKSKRQVFILKMYSRYVSKNKKV